MRSRLLVLGCCVALFAATTLTSFADTRFKTLDEGAVDNPRLGTPDDPEFDCAEPDDEDILVPNCSQVWSEQYNLFGFAPFSTSLTALYHDPEHIQAGELSQRSGVSADRAWKITHGRSEVVVAIVDTGIEWTNQDLRLQVHLNQDELPLPQGPQCTAPGEYDCNGDGAFNADDYAGDPAVDVNGGAHGVVGAVDGEDIIEAFSDSADDDANGYVDDIAGWDFFDDDNDPYDASSYSSADGHGTGRAGDAAARTDNALGRAGVCPDCQLMPLRLWDSFVAPADTYAMAALYATDNGASVLEAALGVLQNSRFAQAASQYAFHNGVVLMHVSSDLNTSNHNYPTNYNNTVFVAGSVADAHGLGQENEDLADGLAAFGIPIGSQAPVATWFRNSGLTQYGGHAAIVMEGDTGSFATGQAAGGAGLIISRGLERVDAFGASFGGPAHIERSETDHHAQRGGRRSGEHCRDGHPGSRAAGLGSALRLRPRRPARRRRHGRAGHDSPGSGHRVARVVRAARPRDLAFGADLGVCRR